MIVTASEEISPTLRDHWADVCAAFHDVEAHHLYVPPEEIEAALARAHAHPPALARGQRAGRIPRPGGRRPGALARRGGVGARARPAIRAIAPSSPGRVAATASARRTTWRA